MRDALDIGCGTGLFWAALARPHYEVRVVLADISRSMIELATTAADPRVAHVRGVEANVQSLLFEDASFYVVIANHVRYHASDPDRAVREIRRVLRPRGTVRASTIGPEHVKELVGIERTVLSTRRERALGDIFGPASGRTSLQRHFAAVEWPTFEDHLRCSDPEDVFAYIASTPLGAHATPEPRKGLREEIVRRMESGRGLLDVTKEAGVFLAR